MINEFLSLNRLFATNILNQFTGGREAIQQFVPRQQLKMRTYFTMINFWESMSKELERGVFDPKSLEEGGSVYKLFESFEADITTIFNDFEVHVDYSEEGLFERWRDGIGRLINRAVLGTKGASYRELEYEFERFWTSFFQLIRKPPVMVPLNETQHLVDDMLTIRAANFTKLKELGMEPEFLASDEVDKNTLALQQQISQNYLQKDIVISDTAADERAGLIAARMLPGVMADAAAMFADSLDGATLLKVHKVGNSPDGDTDKADKTPDEKDELQQAILRELGIELRYSLQASIGLSRILYQSLIDREEWMESALSEENKAQTKEILKGGLSLAEIASGTEKLELMLVNAASNDLQNLHFTAFDPLSKGAPNLDAYFEATPKPFSEVANLPALFEAAFFAQKLRSLPGADEIIRQHFSQYDDPLPAEGFEEKILTMFDPPTINDLLKRLTFKPLWARDDAWLDRSLHFLANKVSVLSLALQKLQKAVLESPEQEPGFLVPAVGDRLCTVYAYRSVLTLKGDVREILVARLQEQLYGRIASQLDDIHEWVANAVAINLKDMLMADLSGIYRGSPNPDKNQLKMLGLEENFIENVFPDWNKKMDASFVAPMEKKLSLNLDLQLGHEFPGYKVLENFNYLQEYDTSTLRGLLSGFLRSVSDVLSQRYSLGQ